MFTNKIKSPSTTKPAMVVTLNKYELSNEKQLHCRTSKKIKCESYREGSLQLCVNYTCMFVGRSSTRRTGFCSISAAIAQAMATGGVLFSFAPYAPPTRLTFTFLWNCILSFLEVPRILPEIWKGKGEKRKGKKKTLRDWWTYCYLVLRTIQCYRYTLLNLNTQEHDRKLLAITIIDVRNLRKS